MTKEAIFVSKIDRAFAAALPVPAALAAPLAAASTLDPVDE